MNTLPGRKKTHPRSLESKPMKHTTPLILITLCILTGCASDPAPWLNESRNKAAPVTPTKLPAGLVFVEKGSDPLPAKAFVSPRDRDPREGLLVADYDTVELSGDVRKAGTYKISAGATITLSDLLRKADGLTRVTRNMSATVTSGTNVVTHSLNNERGQPRVPAVDLSDGDHVNIRIVTDAMLAVEEYDLGYTPF